MSKLIEAERGLDFAYRLRRSHLGREQTSIREYSKLLFPQHLAVLRLITVRSLLGVQSATLPAGGAKAQGDETFLNSIPETGMGSRKGNPNPSVCAPNDITMLRAILWIDRKVK
jgi:hypothetical protein